MKPRTKIERRVCELAPTLPGPTNEQQCKMLKFADAEQGDYSVVYCTIAQRCEEFQVFRVFNVLTYNGNSKSYFGRCNADSPHKYFAIQGECYQIWMNENGKVVINGRSLNFMTSWKRPMFHWRFYEPMSIKKDHMETYRKTPFYMTTDYFITDSWHPTFVRNFGGRLPTGYETRKICKVVMEYPFMETLYKQKDQTWFNLLMENFDPEIIPAIKIAFRKKYFPTYTHTYLDHLRLLNRLGKDLRNPFYVCPADLEKEHRHYYEIYEKRRREEYERINAERRLRLIEEEKGRAESYLKRITPFLGLSWQTDKYSIIVCPSVEAMVEEGKMMHHCVGSMGYDKKTDSLILFCRTPQGERISTIEYSISGGRVIQNRAVCNQTPLYFTEVNELLNSDAKRIQACKIININQNKVQSAATIQAVAA